MVWVTVNNETPDAHVVAMQYDEGEMYVLCKRLGLA